MPPAPSLFLTHVLPLLMLSGGLGLLAKTVARALRTRAFTQRALSAVGTVVALKREHSGDTEGGGSIVYRPVVEFPAAGGGTVRFESLMASEPPAHRVGDSVEVLYDPACPTRAHIRSFLTLWGLPLLLGGLGLVFTTLGARFLLFGIPP